MQPTGQLGTFSPEEPSSGRRSWATHRWHKDGAVVFPNAHELFENVPRLFREHILLGHLPPAPMLQPSDTVVTLGSCFAQELRNVLETARFSSGSFWIPSGLNNTFAILDFVAWCITGEVAPSAYRYDRDAAGAIREWTPDEERDAYLAHIRGAGAFVFTLGLSEVWTDRDTGLVFWRGVPEEIFDEGRHDFRLSTVDENVENMRRTIELIRSVNADAPIVLTLSPVPLQATFRPQSCITADCVSKSVLRVALDQVMASAPDDVYYWPSFELVKWGGAAFDWSSYHPDTRHVDRYLVQVIIAAFAEAFYGPEHAAVMRQRLADAGSVSHHPHRLRVAAARARRFPGRAAARARRAPGRLRRELARRGLGAAPVAKGP